MRLCRYCAPQLPSLRQYLDMQMSPNRCAVLPIHERCLCFTFLRNAHAECRILQAHALSLSSATGAIQHSKEPCIWYYHTLKVSVFACFMVSKHFVSRTTSNIPSNCTTSFNSSSLFHPQSNSESSCQLRPLNAFLTAATLS